MDRKNNLEKYIEEYREERLNFKKNNLRELKQNLTPGFCEKLNFIIEDQRLTKRVGPGKVEVIYLCRLLSSGYTESYESILGISNNQIFLDKNKSETYWCPKYIYKDIENNMEKVERRLKRDFKRVEEYELLHLKQLLLMDDWELLKVCFNELVQQNLQILTNSCLNYESDLKVMCGHYMEQLQLQSSYRIRQ